MILRLHVSHQVDGIQYEEFLCLLTEMCNILTVISSPIDLSFTKVLRVCMGLSVFGHPNPSNPSENLPSLIQSPASSMEAPDETVGGILPTIENLSSSGSQNCDANERYSSLVGRCVATSLLSVPPFGGHCKSGMYDSVSKMFAIDFQAQTAHAMVHSLGG